MKGLQQFNYEGKTAVRGKEINGEPWLVAKDVCKALGYKNHNDAIKKLDDDEKLGSEIATPNKKYRGYRDAMMVNQSGLYHLIFRSNKPEAKKFRRWVTQEVLPAVMEKGEYKVDPKPTTVSKVKPVIYVASSTRKNLHRGIIGINNTADRHHVWDLVEEFIDSLYVDVSREVNGV